MPLIALKLSCYHYYHIHVHLLSILICSTSTIHLQLSFYALTIQRISWISLCNVTCCMRQNVQFALYRDVLATHSSLKEILPLVKELQSGQEHGSYRGCKIKFKDFLRTFQGLTRHFQGLFFAAGTSLCRRLIW